MAHKIDEAVLLFIALVGLYSPVAGVSSYIPLLQPYERKEQNRIALGVFLNVAGIAVGTILIGEPLLILLGLTTASLSATGGISLMFAAIPLMLGRSGEPEVSEGADSAAAQPGGSQSARPSWRSVVFVPFTFPLTIGGATIGILVAFRADVHGITAITALVIAAVAYATVTGVSVIIAGHAQRRLSDRARSVLDRVAGILLVAIASTLLASGFTRLVLDVLHSAKIL